MYYWNITDDGVMDGYPKKINKYWKKLPSNLDAAVYSRFTKRTYFFKGKYQPVTINIFDIKSGICLQACFAKPRGTKPKHFVFILHK